MKNANMIRIQKDVSGIGNCWRDVDDPQQRVIEALVDKHGDLVAGAEANVGGVDYRVIE